MINASHVLVLGFFYVHVCPLYRIDRSRFTGILRNYLVAHFMNIWNCSSHVAFAMMPIWGIPDAMTNHIQLLEICDELWRMIFIYSSIYEIWKRVSFYFSIRNFGRGKFVFVDAVCWKWEQVSIGWRLNEQEYVFRLFVVVEKAIMFPSKEICFVAAPLSVTYKRSVHNTYSPRFSYKVLKMTL